MAEFESEPALAVLVDIENLSRPGARNRGDFDIHLVLGRLAEKGRVVVKRAYADWSRYRDARRELMNAGLELIEMPSAREGAKNRADIKMAVDAMEIAYSRSHVTTFVIVSGDSDFTPLIGKLRELNKKVIGIGRDESSASQLLIANCDEFYFYDSMAANSKDSRPTDGVRPDALSLLRETMVARQREGDEHPQASAVKDSMRRRDPAFSESDIGYSTFSKFLEDAQSKGVVRLITDPKSGTYLVQLLDGGPADWPSVSDTTITASDPAPETESSEPTEGRRRRRRRRSSSDSNGESSDETPTPSRSRSKAKSTSDEAPADSDSEVFEWKVPEREPDLPPLDQPLSYEDVLLAPDEEPTSSETPAEPPTRGARRRRKALSAVPEPEVTDLEAATDTGAEAATDAPTEDAPAAPVDEESPAAAEETPAEEAPADETPADEEPKPRRRGRVKRGSVLPPVADEAGAEATADTPDEKPAEDTPAEEAPAEEKPKPRRRTTRRKTTAATDDTEAKADTPEEKPADEAPAADTTAEETPAEEKPKPRRRTTRRKTTAATDDTEAKADTPEEKPADEAPAADTTAEETPAEEKPKPRRRTTRRKTTAATDDTEAKADTPEEKPADEAPAADTTAEETPAEEKPKPRRRTTRRKTTAATDDTEAKADTPEEKPADEAPAADTTAEETPAEEKPKPRRRTTRRKTTAATDEATETPAAESGDASSTEE